MAPGFFTANFRILGAETSAFCNHAAQTAQVANEGNISIFEREGRAAPKRITPAYAVIFDDSGYEGHPVQIAECMIWRIRGSAVE
ncbi:hypothetical protein ACC704_24810 [Rhizobium johnstonii]